MCTLCVKLFLVLHYVIIEINKKKWIMQEERDKEIMGDRNGPT